MPTAVLVVVWVIVAFGTLLFALSGPWEGPLTVSAEPIDTILRDLRGGIFQATGLP
jgi:hypothetical protein